MMQANMRNKRVELNMAQMDAVRGGWTLLDLVGEGIEILYDDMKETIEKYAGNPNDPYQAVPGLNVY